MSHPATATPSCDSSAQTAYRCRVITTPAAFEALKPQWDDFLKRCGVGNLSLTHSFLSAWMRSFPPEQLLILLVKDDQGEWAGLGPFQISRSRKGLTHRVLRHLCWLGSDPTVFDWMQCVISPEADESAVLRAMAETMRQTSWEVLDLSFGLRHGQLRELCGALRLQPVETALWQCDVMPVIALPPVLPNAPMAYEAMRRPKTRRDVNRNDRALCRDFGAPARLVFRTGSPETDALIDGFVREHIRYWAARGERSDFQRYPALAGFYKSLLIPIPGNSSIPPTLPSPARGEGDRRPCALNR